MLVSCMVYSLAMKIETTCSSETSVDFQHPAGHILTASVVKGPGYRSRGLGSIPGATDFLRSSGSGTGSAQPREYN
jgi:hypothetical protein